MEVSFSVWSVVVAAIAGFAVGGLWFSSLLFAKPWMAALGKTPEEIKQISAGPGYLAAAVGSIVGAYILAQFIAYTGSKSMGGGIQVAILAWLGFVLATSAPDYLFTGRPRTLLVIHSGHVLVSMLVQGAILGAWNG